MRPIAAKVFTGPTVVDIPVDIDWTQIQSSMTIVTESNQYGVEVVEQPVECLSTGSKRGRVTLALQPGISCVVSPSHFPWRLTQPDEKSREMLQLSAQRSVVASRARAKHSDEPAGWIQTSDGVRCLSVRLGERCGHDSSTLLKRKCGHHFCQVCNGTVCPVTRNVHKGPKAVVSCNRQYDELMNYSYLFQEVHGCATAYIVPQMRKWAKSFRDGTLFKSQETRITEPLSKVNFEIFKKSIKAREVFHRHYQLDGNC